MTEKRISEITIIILDRKVAAKQVNDILFQYGDMILARMGVPYREKNLHIISIVIEASTDEVGALTGKLGQVPDVKVKSITV